MYQYPHLQVPVSYKINVGAKIVLIRTDFAGVSDNGTNV